MLKLLSLCDNTYMEIIFFLILLVIAYAFYNGYKIRKAENEIVKQKWDKEEEEVKLKIDDSQQIITVTYAGVDMPMRAWEKEAFWDSMTRAEKRKAALDFKKAMEKGTVKKIDGQYIASEASKAAKDSQRVQEVISKIKNQL